MSKFAEIMKSSPPRLVVKYQRNGGDRFEWGMVGELPVLTLIGAVTRIQSELPFRAVEECDESAFVIAWDGNKMVYFIHPDIPIDPLIGMLDMIKTSLIGSRMAQSLPQVQVLGPHGKPIN